MVSMFDSGLSGPGSLCFILGQDTVLSQCLCSPRVYMYKWLLAHLMVGVTLLLHDTETGTNSGLMSHLACVQTLPFTSKRSELTRHIEEKLDFLIKSYM